jgi:REP element-mobilizing transposase RayT
MPRQPRLDIPGLLHHVIARGVDGCKIFREAWDRETFVTRLSALLLETDTDCFAWALLSNHFHLVLRPNREQLATVMRRLQTGHAVAFNRRHGRSGHLFQNRYKSVVCEEETYLLELVRYVHLNPLRAGLVSDLDRLAHYPWSGHAVLLGRRELPGQAVDEVLSRFGRTAGDARKAYQEFVAAGVAQGRRDDLVGGGLRRSLESIGPTKDRIDYDARVLGGSEFVGRLREQETLRDRLRPPVPLDQLPERVGRLYDLSKDDVCRKGRKPSVVRARAMLCYVAVRELGHPTSEVASLLNMTPSGVSIAIRREQPRIDRERVRQILEG